MATLRRSRRPSTRTPRPCSSNPSRVRSVCAHTGYGVAHEAPEIGEGVTPDIITSAKGLGGGMPIGATITVGDSNTKLLEAGQHGTTFGGNPLSCAAGLAVLETIEKDNVLAH